MRLLVSLNLNKIFKLSGTVEERMIAIYNCLGMDYNEEVELPYQLLKEVSVCRSRVDRHFLGKRTLTYTSSLLSIKHDVVKRKPKYNKKNIRHFHCK